jgi:SAM-dependent methyltransferase
LNTSAVIRDSLEDKYKDEVVKLFDYPKRFPRNRNEACARLLSGGDKILEIGCGSGNLLYNCRQKYKELYGIEFAPNRLDAARKAFEREGQRVNLQLGNIEHGISFEDNSFDSIVWSDVIEHVIDIYGVMKEIKRLLRYGGHLVTSTPNIAYVRYRIRLLSGRFPSTSTGNEGLGDEGGKLFDGGHMHYFTYSSLENIYRRSGLTPVRRMGSGRIALQGLYPSFLSGSATVIGQKI